MVNAAQLGPGRQGSTPPLLESTLVSIRHQVLMTSLSFSPFQHLLPSHSSNSIPFIPSIKFRMHGVKANNYSKLLGFQEKLEKYNEASQEQLLLLCACF